MIPAAVITKLATLGLTADQVSAVAELMTEVEAATEAKSTDILALASRRTSEAARTARYRSNGGGAIPEDMRAAVMERDGFACVYCGSEDHLQCDHVVPVSRGGATTVDNLAVACRVCNAKKKDRDRKAFERALSKEVQGQKNASSDTDKKERSPEPSKEKLQTPHDTTRDRTPEELDRIAAACREAAGAENNPAPALYDLSPILAWLDEGYSLAEEILPVIRRRRPAVPSRLRSWSYFTDAFREAREARDRFVSAAREAARVPRPDEGGSRRPNFSDPVTRALLAMAESGELAAMENTGGHYG